MIAHYLYLAGVKNEREKDLVVASKYCQAAIEVEPLFVDSYVEPGGLLMKIRHCEGALTCCEDAVRLDAKDPSNYENLKVVVTKLAQSQPGPHEKKFQAAKAIYEQIIGNGKLNPVSQQHHW